MLFLKKQMAFVKIVLKNSKYTLLFIRQIEFIRTSKFWSRPRSRGSFHLLILSQVQL